MKNPPTTGHPAERSEAIRQQLYDDTEPLADWERQALPLLAGVKDSAGGAEPAKAYLSVHLVRVVERAVDRLVASSNSNTETMAKLTEKYVSLTDSNVRLQRWVVALTFVVAAAALLQVGVQAWSAFRPTPPPQVLVQPVPVQVTIAPSPTPATPPPSTR